MGTQVSTTSANYGPRGIQVQTMAEAKALAETVIASGLAPKGMDKVATVLIAMQMGAELGLPPMASMQNIAVINGRPTVWGDAMLAICQTSGVFCFESFSEEVTGDGEKMVAICTVRRLPKGKPVVRTFSVADAKRAGLWGKSGPWTQYPSRMLQLRARAFALRDTFADITRGFMVMEEMRDVELTPVMSPTKSARLTNVRDLIPISAETVTSDGEIIERSDSETPQPAREEFALNGSNE